MEPLEPWLNPPVVCAHVCACVYMCKHVCEYVRFCVCVSSVCVYERV